MEEKQAKKTTREKDEKQYRNKGHKKNKGEMKIKQR